MKRPTFDRLRTSIGGDGLRAVQGGYTNSDFDVRETIHTKEENVGNSPVFNSGNDTSVQVMFDGVSSDFVSNIEQRRWQQQESIRRDFANPKSFARFENRQDGSKK